MFSTMGSTLFFSICVTSIAIHPKSAQDHLGLVSEAESQHHEISEKAKDGSGSDDEFGGKACDMFFELNGLSPVELPTTWNEARTELRDLCEREGFQEQSCTRAEQLTFEGYPSGDEEMNVDAEFCGRLQAIVSAVRRMDDSITDDDETTADQHETALLAQVESNFKSLDTKNELDRSVQRKSAAKTTSKTTNGGKGSSTG